MTPHNLKHPELGDKLQRYSEECLRKNVPVSGQYCLGIVCRYFDVEESRGAVLSEVQLLSLTLAGHGIDHLEDFRTRYRFISQQMDSKDMPSERTMSRWLF